MPDQMREALEGAGVESRREAMERAFDSLETPSGTESSGSTGPADTGAGQGGSTGAEPVIKPEGDAEPSPKTKWTGEKPAANQKPAGQQAKPGTQQQQKPAQGAKPGEKPAQGAKPPPSRFKAPTTWKPEEREDWDKIPERARAAIMRREAETNKVLNDSAAARKFGQEFGNIMRPYEAMIRASGVTPLQAVNNLATTAALLQTGTQQQKVSVIARLIGMYGVDIGILDKVLAGQPPPKGGAPAVDEGAIARVVESRLKPVTDFMSGLSRTQRATEETLMRESQQTAEEFASDPQNEFFEDLREDIADLLEMAANRGREMSLKQAYDLAASQHPEISKVVQQRADAQKATDDAAALRRSRRAASSQPAGSPGGIGPGTGKPGNRREAIDQAWNDLSSR